MDQNGWSMAPGSLCLHPGEDIVKSLAGRIGVVAGGSRGIGMGAAIELGAAGAFVYALGRTLEPGTGEAAGSLRQTVQALEELGGRAEPIVCDCADAAALDATFPRVEGVHGHL